MASVTDPRIGQTLAGRYQVRRLLGKGRTGRVYVALDPVAKRKVAVKVLDPALCSDREQLARFEREFDAASRIDCPHTVRMYEILREGDERSLVMELVEGKRLDELADEKGRVPPHRVMWIGAQIARALAAAHEVGVFHRDLNPSNVIVTKRKGDDREQVKVLDFGLARLGDATDNLTATGQRLGRDHYMAPEYIKDSAFDDRSDLYALGCVLYELLAGHPPFIGPSMKVLDGHANRPVAAPSGDVPNLPGWLEELVLQLLAKAPADRPQPASHVADRLEAGWAAEPTALGEPTQHTSTDRALPPTLASGLAHAAPVEPLPMARSVARTSSWGRVGVQVLGLAAVLVASAVVAAGATWLLLAWSGS